jgi:hypothetical protein
MGRSIIMYLPSLEMKKEIIKERNSQTGMSGYCFEVHSTLEVM